MSTILKYSILLLVLTFVLVNCQDDKTRIPSLWARIRFDKSYHVMYNLYLAETEEKLFIQEWASFEKHLFRLDVLAGGVRTTYLTNGRSKEIFRIKPFVCDLLKLDSSELGVISDLFKGWKLGDEPGSISAFGLGPLWLRAEKDGIAEKLKDISSGIEDYTSYEIRFDQNKTTPKLAYNLRLYFKRGKGFIDALDWVSILSDAEKAKDEQPTVAARVKVTLTDLREPLNEAFFNLPVGYGCVSHTEDHPLAANTGLELLHQGGPNQAILEITASVPLDRALHAWESQRYSVRLLRGSMKLLGQAHSYFVALTQSRDVKSGRLKRIKKVWSELDNSEQAVIYTIEEETGKCGVSHDSCRGHIRFPLPSPSLGGPTSKVKNLFLTTDLVASLFNDKKDFHVIREGTNLSSDLDSDENPAGASSQGITIKDAVFEKRIKDFRLVVDATLLWSGPLSILKKISSRAIFSGNSLGLRNGAEFVTTYHTTMTLLFYSEDLSELQYKVVIDLSDKDEVDLNFMHKQLDIGSCFSAEQKSDVVVKYPLTQQQLGRKLYGIQDLIQELFCLDLFQVFPVQPLQVSNVETSFDNFFMYIKMTLLDLPLNQVFQLKRGLRLVPASNIIEKFSPSVEDCASACEYYACFGFSYEALKHKCRISTRKEELKTEEADGSEFYEAPDIKLDPNIWAHDDEYSGGRSHLRPLEMVELFRELYEDTKTNREIVDPSELPLNIRIEKALLPGSELNDPDYIDLIPASIETDIDSMNEFSREQNTLLESADESSKTLIRVPDSSKSFRIQYVIVLEENAFKDSTPGTSLDSLSYEDCEQLCENIDCKSFSYCEYAKSCHVTNLHILKDIQAATRYDVKCQVFSLDYLSKFQNYGPVEVPPAVAREVQSNSISARDCAIFCMEETKFTCQGFYHCLKEPPRGSKRCLMQSKHLEEKNLAGFEHHLPKFKSSVGVDENISKRESCVFYSRSYLTQFDGYFDKTFEIPTETESEDVVTVEVVSGLGAESCAQRCIQESCVAFSVCFEENKIGSSSKEVCQLAKKEFKKSFVVERGKCATYVLSIKSHFNRVATNEEQQPKQPIMGQEKANKEAMLAGQDDIEQVPVGESGKENGEQQYDLSYRMLHLFSNIDRSNPLDGSHWLSKLVSLLVGVLFGVGGVMLWRDKDRYTGMVQNVMRK